MAGALVIGAGPGLGRAIAARFAAEGLPVALLARRPAALEAIAAGLAGYGVPIMAVAVDSTDEAALRGALDGVAQQFGTPDVLVYNAAIIRPDAPGELSTDEQLAAWNVNVIGALTAAAHVAPAMAERGSGSILITGGMPEPVSGYVSLSLGKAGVRALTTMLDQHYGPSGVHAATVTVYGAVAPGTAFDPDEIAEQYWRLHGQPRREWELEVRYTGPMPSAE